MKYPLSLTLLFISLLSFYSCGDDIVNGSNGNTGSNTDFDIYALKINNSLFRFESYVIKEDRTNFRLFSDTLFVLCSAVNNRILLGKIDQTGFSLSSLYSAAHNGTALVNIPIDGYYPLYFDITKDGDKALFTTDAGNYLCVINTDGTGLLQISDGIRGTEDVPKFSPDGKLIAFFEAPSSLETGLFITNTSGTYKKQLTDSIFYSNGFTLDWSPDGSKIVYQSRKGNLNEPVIYLIDTSGNNIEILTGGFNPQWSPNGEKISYLGFGTSSQNDMFIMNPDGTGITNITNSANVYEGNGKWSRDGTKLIYSQQYLGNTELSYYIYEVNTGSSFFLIDSVNGCLWK